jgi:hypothetical protein
MFKRFKESKKNVRYISSNRVAQGMSLNQFEDIFLFTQQFASHMDETKKMLLNNHI